ncbi:hypothetical protein BDY21DRAFT_8096 [Lineolata rhizophorae]|uniref:Secreted protein n=1 Tax=Lineolata rhizophorae TaxID=578093 RepID=A0A6A6PDU2_9PEZI|nr:hypothetical protein BDY21DRAFT_8096 [Lineolata rhizophorae]
MPAYSYFMLRLRLFALAAIGAARFPHPADLYNHVPPPLPISPISLGRRPARGEAILEANSKPPHSAPLSHCCQIGRKANKRTPSARAQHFFVQATQLGLYLVQH